MFQGFVRRVRQASRSIAPAVVPVIESLDPRRMLSIAHPVGHGDYELPVLPPGVEVESSGRTTIRGTDDDDRIVVEYDAASGGIRVSGVAGVEDGTLFTGVTSLSIYAGKGNDTVLAHAGADVSVWMYGEDGDDLLVATGYHRFGGFSGGPGNDTLIGGTGNEQFHGGPGNDHMDGGGGSGSDLLQFDFPNVTSRPDVRPEQGIVVDDGHGFSDTFTNIAMYNDIDLGTVIIGGDSASTSVGGPEDPAPAGVIEAPSATQEMTETGMVPTQAKTARQERPTAAQAKRQAQLAKLRHARRQAELRQTKRAALEKRAAREQAMQKLARPQRPEADQADKREDTLLASDPAVLRARGR